MALIEYTVSDESIFSFEENYLFIKTIDTIIFCIYNLDRPMSITSYEIDDTISERKKKIHAGYGIHGVNYTLTIN